MKEIQMKKGNMHVSLIKDVNQSLGRCRGKGNYVIERVDGKFYRVSSILEEYKQYKEQGFKVESINW